MASNSLDLSNVPGIVTITNNGTKTVNISISGMNQQFPLAPDTEVKLKAETSSELLGYLSQETEDIVVELPEASEEGGGVGG